MLSLFILLREQPLAQRAALFCSEMPLKSSAAAGREEFAVCEARKLLCRLCC